MNCLRSGILRLQLSTRPHIIVKLPADLTAEDEELGTDHRHGMVETTAGSGTDH
jgi:hypothetical protein